MLKKINKNLKCSSVSFFIHDCCEIYVLTIVVCFVRGYYETFEIGVISIDSATFENCTKKNKYICPNKALTVFMLIEGATGDQHRNSHTHKALHKSGKSSLSHLLSSFISKCNW